MQTDSTRQPYFIEIWNEKLRHWPAKLFRGQEICQIRPWFGFSFLKFISKMNIHIQTLSNSRDGCDRSICAPTTFSENLRDLPKSFTKISSSSKKYYVGHCGLLYFVYFWALHCYHNLYLFRFWYSYTLVHKSGYGKYAEQL